VDDPDQATLHASMISIILNYALKTQLYLTASIRVIKNNEMNIKFYLFFSNSSMIFDYLELNGSRELKDDILTSELLVDSRESIKLVFKRGGILGIKEDLEGLGTINLLTKSLTNNFGGVNHIIQDGIVNSGQSARSGTGLLTVVTTTRNSQDTTLSNKDNMTIRELLFEFTSEPVHMGMLD